MRKKNICANVNGNKKIIRMLIGLNVITFIAVILMVVEKVLLK